MGLQIRNFLPLLQISKVTCIATGESKDSHKRGDMTTKNIFEFTHPALEVELHNYLKST